MADKEMTLRGRILLLVPIYLLLGGFLLQNPYLPVISASLFSLFIYSRYHFGRADREIKVENDISGGGKYVDEKFYLYQNIVSKHPLYFEMELDDLEDIEVESDKELSGTLYSIEKMKHELVPKGRGNKKIGSLKGYIYDSMKFYREEFYRKGDIEVTVHSSKEAIKRAQRYSKRIKSDLNIKNLNKFVIRSSELDTIRDYQPGDRMRDIHWKSMSKFQDLMTKTYEKRTPVDYHILLDCSPSMRRGKEKGINKLEHSIYISLELLKNFELSGHDFGITVFDHKKTLYHQSPDHKRETYQRIYKDLSNLPSKVSSKGFERANYDRSSKKSDPREEKFTKAVSQFISKNKRVGLSGILSAVNMVRKDPTSSSLVIIISDMETSTGSVIKAIENLKQMDREVWVIVPFSPWYLVEDITEETLINSYKDHEELETILYELNRLDVSTFLLHPSTEGFKILMHQEGHRR
ncbi:MAG: DUF58 domain-containing protein [Candidatus Saliniplasma sp.]